MTGQNICYSGVNCVLGPSKSIRYSGDRYTAGFVPTYFTVILPCIRPVSEYACQVFHNGLPEYLSEELEKIQRRALLLRIIFPDLGYQEALKECNIATLHQRRQWLTERLFNEIKDNSLHKLHH